MSLKTLSIGAVARAMAVTALLGGAAVPFAATAAVSQTEVDSLAAELAQAAADARAESLASGASTPDDIYQRTAEKAAAILAGKDPATSVAALKKASDTARSAANTPGAQALYNARTFVQAALDNPTGSTGSTGSSAGNTGGYAISTTGSLTGGGGGGGSSGSYVPG